MTEEEIIEIIKKELNDNNHDIEIELVGDGHLPTYSHPYDAGADVYSREDITIKPGETKAIPIGFKMNIPQNYEIQIRARSGISLNTPLRLANSVGTIDCGYKNEFCVIMNNISVKNNGTFNLSSKGNQEGVYIIHKNERIAQIILARFSHINFKKVEILSDCNDRNGGIGHTGIN